MYNSLANTCPLTASVPAVIPSEGGRTVEVEANQKARTGRLSGFGISDPEGMKQGTASGSPLNAGTIRSCQYNLFEGLESKKGGVVYG